MGGWWSESEEGQTRKKDGGLGSYSTSNSRLTVQSGISATVPIYIVRLVLLSLAESIIIHALAETTLSTGRGLLPTQLQDKRTRDVQEWKRTRTHLLPLRPSRTNFFCSLPEHALAPILQFLRQIFR